MAGHQGLHSRLPACSSLHSPTMLIMCVLRVLGLRAEESSPGLDPGVYIDRALRETVGRVSVSTINRYSSLGYRFVGSFSNRTGMPSSPTTTLDDPGYV